MAISALARNLSTARLRWSGSTGGSGWEVLVGERRGRAGGEGEVAEEEGLAMVVVVAVIGGVGPARNATTRIGKCRRPVTLIRPPLTMCYQSTLAGNGLLRLLPVRMTLKLVPDHPLLSRIHNDASTDYLPATLNDTIKRPQDAPL